VAKKRIAVFSGPSSTIANSPPLVTSNKARLSGERKLQGPFDVLVPQLLYEPVRVKIKKFSAHPLEEDASDVYHDNGKDYYEVELLPEDGPYLLPYMSRRKDGTPNGTPFEAEDLENPKIRFGGRQGFYPDASRIFTEIDRTIAGRSDHGEANILATKADFTFIRALPPAGYTKKGERAGVDYFPYKPYALTKNVRVGDLARVTNAVQTALKSGLYDGGIWLEGSPSVEETLYWLSLTVDTDLPIAGNAAQRTHGQLSADGDRNIVDSVDYITCGAGRGLGAVGIQDQQIFAAREFRKADDRPGNYKAVGGHGGILGTVKAGRATIWYRPNYKHTSISDVNLTRLPEKLELEDSAHGGGRNQVMIKNADGTLRAEAIPHVHIVKYAAYSQEDESADPLQEVDIIARIEKALSEEKSEDERLPKLHGLVLEGNTPYARGTTSQLRAIWIAALSGLPVVRASRSDPGGRVVTEENDLTIEASNLDSTKARMLLIASMLKLGRLPRAKDPRNPTGSERGAVIEKVKLFQDIFETH
jgi:L-asparaginase